MRIRRARSVLPLLGIIAALGVTLTLPATAATPHTTTVRPLDSGTITGDFNGDGLTDTAVLVSGAGPTCTVTVQLGVAGGGFGPPTDHSYTTLDTGEPCPDQGFALKLGHQTRSDLIVGDSFGVGRLMVLHNFHPIQLVQGVIQPDVTRIEDVNGDGRPDIVQISNQVTQFGTLINTPQATLEPGPFSACTTNEFGFPQYALADFDGSGTFGMVLSSYCPPTPAPDTVQVLFSDGHAPVTLISTNINPLTSFTPFALDFNHDGSPDIGVIQHGGGAPTTVSYFQNDGHGNFTPVSGP